jgi:hypothetical protein
MPHYHRSFNLQPYFIWQPLQVPCYWALQHWLLLTEISDGQMKITKKRNTYIQSDQSAWKSSRNWTACFCFLNYLAFLRQADLKKFEEGRWDFGLFASKRSKTPHGAYWSPLGAKSASTDAPNKRTQLIGEPNNRTFEEESSQVTNHQ